MARKKVKVKLKLAKKGKSFTEQLVGPLDDIYGDVTSMSRGVQSAYRRIPGAPKLPGKK